MEIFIDENSGLEYVNYDDLTLEEYKNLNPETKRFIDGEIVDDLHRLTFRLIEMDSKVNSLNDVGLTHEEIAVYKAIIIRLWLEISAEKDASDNKEGMWRYLDFNIYEFYDRVIENHKLSLDELLNINKKEV